MNVRRVLVTGGTGFVGRHAIEPLRAAGCDVHIAARRPAPPADGVTVHAIDLHDHDAASRLVGAIEPDALLHLAWDVTPGRYAQSLANLQWVRATLVLAEAFARHGGRRLVMAGTSAEYDWRDGRCAEGQTALAPASIYGACKHAVHVMLEPLAAQQGFSLAWGRIFFLYGPHEPADRLVPRMIAAARRASPLVLRHPDQRRDYLHVSDVGAAFAALLLSDVQGPVNIASGDATALATIAALVGESAGAPVPLAPGDRVDDPAPIVYADITRLRDEVGFVPTYGLAAGLDQTVQWWATQKKTVGA